MCSSDLFHPLVRPCVRSLRFHPASFRPLSFPFAPVRLGLRYSVSVSFRLSTPVSRRFFFLPLRSVLLFAPLAPLPDTQLPVLPFSPPSVPPPSGFPNAPALPFVPAGSSPFLTPGFPFASPGSAYSAFLFVPFRSSLLRSHSRSTGAPASFRFYPFICWFVLASVPSGSTQPRFLGCPSPSLPSV